MLVLPRWLVFGLAALVLVFGAYRVYVALRRDDGEEGVSHWRQVSVFGRTKRAHLIYGLLYLAAGAMLVASGFGWQMPLARGCQSMLNRGEPVEPQPAPEDPRSLDLEPAPKPEQLPETR